MVEVSNQVTKATLRNRYFIFRHGESESNLAGKICCRESEGVTTAPLSQFGVLSAKESAAKLLRQLASPKNIVVIASNYLRARQTASVIADVLGCSELRVDRRLRERECLDLHDRTGEEFRSIVWEDDRADRQDLPTERESVALVLQRMSSVVLDLEREFENRVIALVTHCDPGQILRSSFSREVPPHLHFTQTPFSLASWIELRTAEASPK